LSLYDPSIQKEKLSFVWHLIGELHRPGDSPFLKGPWRTWSGPAADPGELLYYDIPSGAQLEDHWRCVSVKISINSSKFYKLWSWKLCRRLQRQKKWESPPIVAENFPIHVPFFGDNSANNTTFRCENAQESMIICILMDYLW